jgi:hypothetical protein
MSVSSLALIGLNIQNLSSFNCFFYFLICVLSFSSSSPYLFFLYVLMLLILFSCLLPAYLLISLQNYVLRFLMQINGVLINGLYSQLPYQIVMEGIHFLSSYLEAFVQFKN